MLLGLPTFLGILALHAIWRPKLLRPYMQRLSILLPLSTSKAERRVWLHAVSVGEVISCEPLIKRLQKEDISIWLSTATITGFETAKRKVPELTVFYFPFDFPFVVSRILKWVDPDVVFLCELEIWPSFVWSVHKRNIPLYLISGRMVEKDFIRYRRFKWFFGHVFSMFSALWMQNDTYTERMRELCGQPRAKTLGSLKFDVNPTSENFNCISELMPTGFILCAVSTHRGEERMIIKIFQSLMAKFPQIRLVLVPRHPHRKMEIARILEKAHLSYTLRSENRTCLAPVFLVDTIGELSGIYTKSDLVIMGGSFSRKVGGHNIIEPASFGKCILCGNHMENFEDVYALFKREKALVTTNRANLLKDLKILIQNKNRADQLGKRALRIVTKNRGVSEKIYNHVFKNMPVR